MSLGTVTERLSHDCFIRSLRLLQIHSLEFCFRGMVNQVRCAISSGLVDNSIYLVVQVELRKVVDEAIVLVSLARFKIRRTTKLSHMRRGGRAIFKGQTLSREIAGHCLKKMKRKVIQILGKKLHL